MDLIGDFYDDQGQVSLDEGRTLVDYVEENTVSSAGTLAYRYIDYSASRDGQVHELTWEQFGVRSRAIGARLQQVTEPGDRVAILAPQGLDYVTSFFGAIYGGVIAVPLFDPDEPGHGDRLEAVLADCEPAAILTATRSAAGVRKLFRHLPAKQRPRIIAVDAIPDEVAQTWTKPAGGIDSIAYLQYTSGSTRTPAGVEITHRGVLTNAAQMADGIGLTLEARGVTWLPLFHDMGLLTVILPAVGGRYVTIMSPRAFVQRPGRWIRELAASADGAPTFAAAPNFAFEHAATRGLPKDGEALDLSNVIGLINGSEPVTTSSMRRFTDAFAPYGFAGSAIKPSYGMAEATLFVSTTAAGADPRVVYVDRAELGRGVMREVAAGEPGAVPQVGCGYVSVSQWAAIVDPETGIEQPDGHVGEIWLYGDNVGIGYWGCPDETEQTFRNRIVERQETGSRAAGVPEDAGWMSTGDYGVYHDGELFITGRVKDLVIVDGRNHYPQDIEATVQETSAAIRPNFAAAFAVPRNQLPDAVFEHGATSLARDPEDSSEQLVIVAERAAGKGKTDPAPIAEAVRGAVSSRHGVTARDVLLVPAGSIPRTSSGKIARRACKAAYINGTLRGGYQQQAFPDVAE